KAGAMDRGAAMGIAWGDFDGDGYLDLYISNMYANSRWALFHPDFPPPVPWYLSWFPRSAIDSVIHELSRGSTLLHNNGDGTFTDVGYVDQADRIEDGRGVSIFDYDQDGQLDVVLRNYNQPAQLLHNTGGSGHWLELKLTGVHSNRDALGARITLQVGD